MTHCMHLSGRETTRVLGAVRRGQGIKVEPGSQQSGGIAQAGLITWLKAGPRMLPPICPPGTGDQDGRHEGRGQWDNSLGSYRKAAGRAI